MATDTNLLPQLEAGTARSVHVLTAAERQSVLQTAQRLGELDITTRTEPYVEEAQVLAAELPVSLRRALLRFRRSGSPVGGLLIRGLPLGDVPPTPSRADEGTGLRLTACAVLSLCTAVLGDQFGFAPELSGQLVQDILPIAGFEHTQTSVSSRDELELHVETAFAECRADFVGLLCLRPDHLRVAGTSLASIEDCVSRLDLRTLAVLREPRFLTSVDQSFLAGMQSDREIFLGPIPLITGTDGRPRVRVDFAQTVGLDGDAQKALESLQAAARSVATIVRLDAGDLVLVDNHHALHGRTPFTARWDGADRWLLRTFVTRDLGRSAPDRKDDGRIVDTDYASISPAEWPRRQGHP